MLMSPRLTAQLNRNVEQLLYSDLAYLVIDIPTGLYDDYNNPISTETEVAIECRFSDKPAAEQWKAYVDLEQLEAEISFNDPIPHNGDRIKLGGRFGGTDGINQTYEIIGIRNRDKFGFTCALKAVQI